MPSSRRSFVKLLAAVPAAPLLEAQQAKPAKPKPSPAAERTAEALFARYGERLSEQQRREILEAVGNYERDIAAVRAFRLLNADEPFGFRVYREDRRDR